MAEYQITPYVVQVYPSGDPNSPMKMGRASLTGAISVLDAITNTFIALSREEKPRKRPNVRNRKLKVATVKRNETQVEATCKLGVSGYVSQMNLQELAVSVHRGADDDEWFDLRVVFAAIPSMRAGLLLVEGVGNYGIVTMVTDMLKSAVRQNLGGTTTLKIKPVQDAQAWAETFGALSTQALEFHTLIQTGDPSDEAPTGGKHRPLTKIIKIKRRGGLGAFKSLSGKSLHEVADIYGIGHDIDEHTWATATLGGSGARPRKINIRDNKVSSISFPVSRKSKKAAPTPAEFYEVANKIATDVRSGLGLGTLNVTAPVKADTRTINKNDAANWTVPNEAPTDDSDRGAAEDAS